MSPLRRHTGWPKTLAPFFLYALTLPNINRFSKLFHCQNQEKICNNTITKHPTTPQVWWDLYGANFFGPPCIFVCFMAKSAFWGVSPPNIFHRFPLPTLKIWGAGVYSPRSYGAEFVVFLFFLSVTLRC